MLSGPRRQRPRLRLDEQGNYSGSAGCNALVGTYQLDADGLRFLPGATDMATFGQMFRAVVAENDEACAAMGWQPLSVTRGFAPGDNVVTLTSVRAVRRPRSS